MRLLQRWRGWRARSDDGLGRGVALRGAVWTNVGPGYDVRPDSAVLVDGAGRLVAVQAASAPLPRGFRVLGGPDFWIGPGVVDAHVHLSFAEPAEVLAGGVVGVRDLGAAPRAAAGYRGAGPPACTVSGPVLTSPGGYPGRTWGAGGLAATVDSPEQAGALVRSLAAGGADLIKVALEPAGQAAVPTADVLRATVRAAHEAGLGVTAHALTAAMVARALDAGVDELAHTPVERLDDVLVARIAAAGIAVVSTLQTFFSGGDGRGAAANAAALHAAGVRLLYGTDLGNAGTTPGVDPRELDRLADTGLGRVGALRCAVETADHAVGAPTVPTRLIAGQPASLVLLPGDPVVDPSVWRLPTAVVAGGRLVSRQAGRP